MTNLDKQFVVRVVLITWAYVFALSIVLFLVRMDFYLALSFFLGSALSLFSFTSLAKTNKKLLEAKKPKSAFPNFIIRYVLVAVVLYYCHINPKEYSIYACFAGIFSVKICMFAYLLLRKGELKKDV